MPRYRPSVVALGVMASAAVGVPGFDTATARADDLLYLQRDQLRQIKQRIITEVALAEVPDEDRLLRAHVRRLNTDVARMLATENGYWSVYDSAERPGISYNGRAFHLPARLAAAYRTEASRYHQDPAVLEAVEKGLDHLFTFVYPDCPKPNNWWAWEIGIPTHLLSTLILLEGELDDDLFDRGVRTVVHLLKIEEDVFDAASWIRPADDEITRGKTDMNALWRHQLRLRLGVLVENPAIAGPWAIRTFAEMGRPGEGHLQEDLSYKFHGPIPMWAYGRAYVVDYARLIDRYAGTDFSPTPEQLDDYAVMAEHFVNGFLYRNRLNPAMIGREISRGPDIHANPLVPVPLAVLAKHHPDRAEAFAALLARERRHVRYDHPTAGLLAAHLAGVPDTAAAPPVHDIFAYPDSDFLQVTRPDWALGIKMHSSRNRGFESINRENLQGWYLSHGTMFPFVRGDEWDGAWPTLDWTRLPGSTVAERRKGQNESAFAGVLRASDQVALAALELRDQSFTARKSWLINGNHIVCLGSGISGQGRIETTILNQPLRDDMMVLVNGRPLRAGPIEETQRVETLSLDTTGYLFPGGQEVLIIREERTSDWSSIRDPALHGETDAVTHTYLTVVIRHRNQGDPGYGYIVLPGYDAAALADRAESILSYYRMERAGRHRVRTIDGTVDAVTFWEPGEAADVAADRGCMLLGTGEEWRVVDPTWSGESLTVTVDGRATGVTPRRGRPVEVR